MTTLRELLPWRDWWHGPARSTAAWSSLAAVLVGCGAVSAALLIDVAVDGGRIAVREGAEPEFQGLAATAARYDAHWSMQPIIHLCRRVPWLNDGLLSAIALSAVLVLVVLLHRAVGVRVAAAAARASGDVARRLRRSIHRQALRLTPGDLDGSERRSSLALFTDDVDRIAASLELWVGRLPREGLTALVLLVIALCVDVRLTVQCLVPIVLAGWLSSVVDRRARANLQLALAKSESELRLLSEGLLKSRLVCGYGMEAFEHEQFEKHLGRYTDEIQAARFGADWHIGATHVAVAVCVGVAGVFAAARMLSPVDPLPLAAVFLLGMAVYRVRPIVRLTGDLQVASETLFVSNDRIKKYLSEIPEVGQAVGAKFMEPVSKSIILESVSYQRHGQPVLDKIDLRMTAGTATSIVSMDPVARRALAFLLPRFIEPSSGRVLFDSEDTAWGTLESIRAEIVFVGADDPFFTGTVLQNLTGGDDRYSLEQVTEAAKRAHAHNFIQRLPQGYETVIGEHGELLDPGQAFRLGIARAELRNPAVLILEEPSSRLDDDTKALLDDTYQRLLTGRTVVILPSRLSTVRRCDQVALIHDGRIAAVGPHETLVRQHPLYRHWEYVTFNTPPAKAAATDGRQPAPA